MDKERAETGQDRHQNDAQPARPHIVAGVGILHHESAVDVLYEVRRSPVGVGVNGAHKGGQQTGHDQTQQPGWQGSYHHQWVGHLAVGKLDS